MGVDRPDRTYRSPGLKKKPAGRGPENFTAMGAGNVTYEKW